MKRRGYKRLIKDSHGQFLRRLWTTFGDEAIDQLCGGKPYAQ